MRLAKLNDISHLQLDVPRKGQDWTKDFMDEKCKLVFPKATDPGAYGASFAETASFISKLNAKEGVSRVSLDIPGWM